jgi:hypothetical protein
MVRKKAINARPEATSVALVGAGFCRPATAQNSDLQQRVAEIKESSAKNKQALTSYSWTETITINLKGEQKKQEHFQVRFGPDLKPQKTPLDPPAEAAASSGGRVKQRVVAKKKEEYKDYADQMKTLAQQYVPPYKDLLQQAYAKRNLTLSPAAGNSNELQLIIHNYLKPQDSMTLVLNKTQKALLQVKIASYMDDPTGVMNLTVTFTSLPDGTNHVSNLVIDGLANN